jgi:hypothetical protein
MIVRDMHWATSLHVYYGFRSVFEGVITLIMVHSLGSKFRKLHSALRLNHNEALRNGRDHW